MLAKRVINNIVSNSVKYMDKSKKKIEIRILDEQDSIRVEIEDNGRGISARDLPNIFDRFYRAAPYPDDRGNGLGLSIVRRVVTLCGGRVTVFSRPGNGSTFTVTLPAEE